MLELLQMQQSLVVVATWTNANGRRRPPGPTPAMSKLYSVVVGGKFATDQLERLYELAQTGRDLSHDRIIPELLNGRRCADRATLAVQQFP